MRSGNRTVLDYISAVKKAARGNFIHYPQALYSVLACRLTCGLGPRFHSLYDLIDTPQREWKAYLDNDRTRVLLRSVNQPAARQIANDKLIFNEHCAANAIATIPVLAAILANAEDSAHLSVSVDSEQEWCNRLLRAPDQIFIKPIDGTWGRGAFVARRAGQHWRHHADQESSAAELYQQLQRRMHNKRGWMVQPFVAAHPSLQAITSGRALPTIRANTFWVNGQPQLLFAILRIPVGNNVTDNFQHGTSGNIIAAIDLQNGQLGKCLGSASRNWPDICEIPRHPDTGNVVQGFQIPMWDQLLALLLSAHSTLPELQTLGWDVAITADGPLIVETNATYDVDIIQVAYQRGVRKDIEEIFGPVV